MYKTTKTTMKHIMTQDLEIFNSKEIMMILTKTSSTSAIPHRLLMQKIRMNLIWNR